MEEECMNNNNNINNNNNNPEVGIHLLQHTLRSLCGQSSQWVYAVFWRILPRNYPPPDALTHLNSWDLQTGAQNGSGKNRRIWMLAWEDGFCNFLAARTQNDPQASSSSDNDRNCHDITQQGLQPDLFFKMSHEIHNYGEGLIGKVAADRGHKYVHSEKINLSVSQNSRDPITMHPKTWRRQFQSGIKTISLIATEEGVLQLGAVKKVSEDLSHVVQLQKKFSLLLRAPGFLFPRPPSSTTHSRFCRLPPTTSFNAIHNSFNVKRFHIAPPTKMDYTISDSNHFNQQPIITSLSMSSLDRLLLKLPLVVPAASPLQFHESFSPCFEYSRSQEPVQEVMAMDDQVANK